MNVPADFAEDDAIMELIEAKQAAVAADLGNPATHLALGLALVVNNGPELAEEAFQNVLALEPGDAEARFQLAKIRGEAGDIQGQIEELRRCLKYQPNFLAAHYTLACALLDEGQLQPARESFEKVRESNVSSSLGEMGIGLVELELGEPKRAITHLLKSLQAYPKEKFVRFKLEQAYREVGRDQMAEQLAETYEGPVGRPLAKSAGDIQAEDYKVGQVEQGLSASLLLDQRRYGEAQVILERLYALNPGDPTTINNLAVTYIHTDKLDMALEVLEAGIEDDPTQYAMYTNAGYALRLKALEEGLGDEAREELLGRALSFVDEGISRAPRFGTAHLQRARVLAAMGRFGKGLEAFEDAIRLGETAEAVYLEMVPLAEARGGMTLVETVLRDGIAKGNVRMELRQALCRALLESGQGERARQEQRAMKAVSPKHPAVSNAHKMLRAQGH